MDNRKRISYSACLICLFMLFPGVVPSESVSGTTSKVEIRNDVLASDSSYATYFGGSNQEDATKVGFDNEGNTVLIGQTQSDDLPVTEGALQTEYGGGDWDGCVAKFHENGTLLWATYRGGDRYEHVTNINVDSSNNIVLTGCTGSSNFHVTDDAYQSTYAGYLDGFIVKLSPSGELLYGSYFGGSAEDWAYGVYLDAQENIIFGGWSASSGLATSGAYKTSPQGNDVFVARMSADGQSIQMFTYLGGTGDDRGWSIGVDADYNIMISGMTTSTNLPCTEGALQDEYSGDTDSYLAIVANDGSSILYLTYIGGDGEDMGAGSDVDSEGNYIHAGFTESDNLQTVNAFQPAFGGGTADSYLLRLSSDFEVSYFTYLGGNETDRCWDARVTPDDTVVLVGRTNSENYPTLNARYLEISNNYDAFASEFSSDGQQLLRSGLFGGLLEDIGEGIAVDSDGSIVITGRAASSVLPLSDAHQEEYGGSRDVFVCHTIFDVQDITTATTTPTQPTEPGDFPMTIV
ncbi:MAG: hypothetical protein ACXAEF_13795, partial [Candidatus Thorarchaeota archaeon]